MTVSGSNPLQLLNGRCVIHVGDVFDRLADIPDESIDVVVTSPPYWGLRDYGTAFWDGGDSRCSHNLGGAIRAPWAKAPTQQGRGSHLPGHPAPPRARAIGGYCTICGARRVDYQIGLEPTLGQHLDVMVDVFAEIWRTLKPHGSAFVNYGDCYAAEPNGRSAEATKAAGDDDRTFRDKPFSTVGPIYDRNYASARGVFEGRQWNSQGYGTRRVDHGGRVVAGGVLKPKDLCMIPNRLAIALQEWGWWVRSEIIWGKPNAMPDSSGRGRPSTAHEKIFLLTKSADADVWRARDTGELSMRPDLSERCDFVSKRDDQGNPVSGAPRWIRIGAYYDATAVMQPSSPATHARAAQNVDAQAGSTRANGGTRANRPMKTVQTKLTPRGVSKNNVSLNAALMTRDIDARAAPKRGIDPRHEGQINHEHLDSLGRGNGRLLRNYEEAPVVVWAVPTAAYKGAHYATFPPQLAALCIAAGAPPENGVVLDPFGGTGTTAMVALRMGRRAQLIELDAKSVDQAIERIEQDWMGDDEKRRAIARKKHDALAAAGQLPPAPLFEDTSE